VRLQAFLFAPSLNFLSFVPVQHTMAVSTQRYAFFDLLHCGGKASISHKFIDASLVFATNHVVEINNRWVLQPALTALLRRLELHPNLFLTALVYSRALKVGFFVPFVMQLLVFGLLNLSYYGVFIWH
jgi:hypothetical protein